MKPLVSRILVSVLLVLLALGLIALGYFTGPKRFIGPERSITIAGSFVVSTNARKTVNVIIFDENNQPWGCASLEPRQSTSNMSPGSPLPANARVVVALGGTMLNTLPNGTRVPMGGYIVTPINGTVEFSGGFSMGETAVTTSAMFNRIRVIEKEHGPQITVETRPLQPMPASAPNARTRKPKN